jgi:hypothetical protein
MTSGPRQTISQQEELALLLPLHVRFYVTTMDESISTMIGLAHAQRYCITLGI